jgi:glycosyltransferase involved in cell wall biosynthesis
MKVTFVSTLERGGPVSHLRGLVPFVVQLGVDVTVVCASRSLATSFESLGARARIVHIRHKADLLGALELWPELASTDVVHTHDRRAGLFGRSLGRARHARVVHTIHGLPEEIATQVGRSNPWNGLHATPRWRRAWYEHGYLRIESSLASLGPVITPSHAMARYLGRRGFPDRRLLVLSSGIEVRRDSPHQMGTPPRIGTAVNLEWWKGVDVLLRACARLRTPFQLELYGDGTDRPALERLARQLGVNATFHGHVDDVADRLADLDLFVLPSRAENFPIALLEAMAWALPVVVTRVGGVPEMVVDRESGLVVRPDDEQELAEAIRHIVENPEAARSLGRAAAQRARDRFDPATAGRQMVEVYERLCGSFM